MRQTPELVYEQKEDRHSSGFDNCQDTMKRFVDKFLRHFSSHSVILSVIPVIRLLNHIPSHALTESEEYSNHLHCLASIARESIMVRRTGQGCQ
jgi:hypothetical protein